MQDTDTPKPQAAITRLYITDKELAGLLGVSAGFLQKDRRTAKRIPFVQLGDRCLYDPDEALAAVKLLTVGGPRGRRVKRATEAA